jgi:hypothetical protein
LEKPEAPEFFFLLRIGWEKLRLFFDCGYAKLAKYLPTLKKHAHCIF